MSAFSWEACICWCAIVARWFTLIDLHKVMLWCMRHLLLCWFQRSLHNVYIWLYNCARTVLRGDSHMTRGISIDCMSYRWLGNAWYWSECRRLVLLVYRRWSVCTYRNLMCLLILHIVVWFDLYFVAAFYFIQNLTSSSHSSGMREAWWRAYSMHRYIQTGQTFLSHVNEVGYALEAWRVFWVMFHKPMGSITSNADIEQ